MRIDRKCWPLGWLAAGLTGLIVLSLLPRRESPADAKLALVEALWNVNEREVARLLGPGWRRS